MVGKNKKLKIENNAGSHNDFKENDYYLSKVGCLGKNYNDKALSLNEILSFSKDDFITSAQFNYCFDVEWLINQYPEKNKNKQLLIVHGFSGSEKLNMESHKKLYPNIEFEQAQLNIPFGTHHTKMMLLLYKTGLRIIIMTANMCEEDWKAKTQGIWLSSIFPKGENLKNSGESFDFKSDLLEYLKSYKSSKIAVWERHIEAHDLSSANVILIGSTPGRHSGKYLWTWGHLKLRKALSTFGPKRDWAVRLEPTKKGEDKDKEDANKKSSTTRNNLPLIAQFSSIGSLGSSKDAWLCSEFATSLLTYRKNPVKSQEPNLYGHDRMEGFGSHPSSNIHPDSMVKLIFPTLQNVRQSLEGYISGGSIPYSSQTHAKQTYLTNFMYQWKSENLGRSRASPHIKTYTRITEDGNKMAWFLLTSANLSKAAWGALEKKGTQLAIRSYELGVLFIPHLCLESQPSEQSQSCLPKDRDEEWFDLGNGRSPIYLPYDFPLTKYTLNDSPWLVNVEHGTSDRDVLGNTWPP